MQTRLLLAIAGALLILRVPSLVQPMGPDQGLYAYIGDRILHHELAYRDAWDQKPPGVHYVYAALGPLTMSGVAAVVLGAAIVPAILLFVFWRGGALSDLYQATIAYNVHYSGETYASRLDMARYLALFPVHHARLDPLWFAGGLGCL